MSETVNRIKQSINKVYAGKFSVDIINELSFIPVSEQKGVFYAVINENSKKAEIENISSLFVTQDELKELYEFFVSVFS